MLVRGSKSSSSSDEDTDDAEGSLLSADDSACSVAGGRYLLYRLRHTPLEQNFEKNLVLEMYRRGKGFQIKSFYPGF
jgi:hypothetical protein